MPDLDTDDPALDYERRLQERLAWREKGHDRLDLAVIHLEPAGGISGLSMNANGANTDRLFTPDQSGGLAITPRLLNASRLVAIAALGPACRDAVANAGNNPEIPRLTGGTLRWYVDRAACEE